MTESERLVFELSKQSFLSIWSFANPLNEGAKELCDVLVVCEPDIIILSVKEIKYKHSGRPEIDSERWRRAAIDESCRQLYGAERALRTQESIISAHETRPFKLPDSESRRVHRVAVALGSQGRVPLTFGNFGKGFVHVLDESSLKAVMSHLDTVSDFVRYLEDKEAYLASDSLTMFRSEEDLLALYVANDNSFPPGPDLLVLDDKLWTDLKDSPEFLAEQEARQVSYVVDGILERFYENFVKDNYRTPWADDEQELRDLELAARAMARESRAARVEMGRRIVELLETTPRTQSRARVYCSSSSPVRYVFMTAHYNGNRELNFKELQARCLVARGLDHTKTRVIGILIERVVEHDGDAVQMVYIDVPEWTDEWQQRMNVYRDELGYFRNIKPIRKDLTKFLARWM